VLLRAGSLGPGVPRRDLRVSPRHAMFIEGVLVPAMLLVNGVSIAQEPPRGEITYFHVELDRHDIVLAEGAPAESFRDEDSRGMFDNAGEWHGRGAEGVACAPKVEHGFRLETLRRRIEARAGIGGAEQKAPGELIGHVDACELEAGVADPRPMGPAGWTRDVEWAVSGGWARIEGWAQDRRHPEAPVCLVVLGGGRTLGRVLANRFRLDLARAGLGTGRHAFSARIAVPEGAIELRREADGALLGRAMPRRAA
jgi:Hint domain